jgi:hypothetical protein
MQLNLVELKAFSGHLSLATGLIMEHTYGEG